MIRSKYIVYLVNAIALLLLMCSCSAEYHLQKAYDKGALNDDTTTTTVQTSTDTVTETYWELIEIPGDTITYNDTINCDSNNQPSIRPDSRRKTSTNNVSTDIDLVGNILHSSVLISAYKDSIEAQTNTIVNQRNEIHHIRNINSRLTKQLEDRNKGLNFLEVAGMLFILIITYLLLIFSINKKWKTLWTMIKPF